VEIGPIKCIDSGLTLPVVRLKSYASLQDDGGVLRGSKAPLEIFFIVSIIYFRFADDF
jgi:hypothetical protein